MTRTWYSLHGAEPFAVGGIWRWSEEWGDVYSMVMVDGCAQMSDVHDRMPVIVRPEQYDQWTAGTPDEAMALVMTCDDTLLVDRTDEPWFKPGKAPEICPVHHSYDNLGSPMIRRRLKHLRCAWTHGHNWEPTGHHGHETCAYCHKPSKTGLSPM